MADKIFTDEQINAILELITQHNAHLQYIGARYVPIFGRKNEDSIEWDNKGTYEPLTIVLHEGNSYTSRQFVPVGIDILNQKFWANTGNYNAQIEQYRQQVNNLAVEVSKLKGYDTLAEMQADYNLEVGDICSTYGRNAVFDGGAANWFITNTKALGGWYENLTNGLYAMMVIKDNVNALACGVKATEEGSQPFDNYTVFNTVRSIFPDEPIYMPKGVYYFSQTIVYGENDKFMLIGDPGNSTLLRLTTDLPSQNIIDFKNCKYAYVRNIATDNGRFDAYAGAGDVVTRFQQTAGNMWDIENLISTETTDAHSTTNWINFIMCPEPTTYERFKDGGGYARYPLEIYNHSGYNAINIENGNFDAEGNAYQISDNSAIGIIDAVRGSAPVIFIDQRAQRSALNFKNRTGTEVPASGVRPDTVFEVGWQGHIAVGCSVYDDPDIAPKVATLKLRDNNPSIRFYDAANKNALGYLSVREGKFRMNYKGYQGLCLAEGGIVEALPVDSDDGGCIYFHSDTAAIKNQILWIDQLGYLRATGTNTTPTTEIPTSGYRVLMNNNGANNPTNLTNNWYDIGSMFFNTTVNKPVWWTGTKWVYADGTDA